MTAERIKITRVMRAEKATGETIAGALHVGTSGVRRALAEEPAGPEKQLA